MTASIVVSFPPSSPAIDGWSALDSFLTAALIRCVWKTSAPDVRCRLWATKYDRPAMWWTYPLRQADSPSHISTATARTAPGQNPLASKKIDPAATASWPTSSMSTREVLADESTRR